MWVGRSGPTLLIFLTSNALVASGCTDPHIPSTEYSFCGILISMVWEVEFTDEFEDWWHSLSEGEQAEMDAKVDLLQEHGPLLPRPHADVIASSRHSNMKELRGKVDTRHVRVLYAFDPRRTALLLIGGDKTGDPKWYEKFVPVADDLFDQHLKQLAEKRQT
jgi:hypothetical protein